MNGIPLIGGEVGGVEWCTEHHGIRNEDNGGECDMADGEYTDEPAACEFHALHWSVPVTDRVAPEPDELNEPTDDTTMVDLGGGMLVPLYELMEDQL